MQSFGPVTDGDEGVGTVIGRPGSSVDQSSIGMEGSLLWLAGLGARWVGHHDWGIFSSPKER